MTPRLLGLGAIALLPAWLKRYCYHLFFGYQVGRGVKIGFSLIDANVCEIGENTRIGHLNIITGVKELRLSHDVRIGSLNVIRGGDQVTLGRYAEIVRMNEITSMRNLRLPQPTDPRFTLGEGATVTVGHKVDFTDRVDIGRLSVLGGRNSSLWTHNRGQTQPVEIGQLTYVGSDIRMAPGSSLPPRCIVGIGSVVVGKLDEEETLIAGVPAKVIRPVVERDQPLVDPWATKPDPDSLS